MPKIINIACWLIHTIRTTESLWDYCQSNEWHQARTAIIYLALLHIPRHANVWFVWSSKKFWENKSFQNLASLWWFLRSHFCWISTTPISECARRKKSLKNPLLISTEHNSHTFDLCRTNIQFDHIFSSSSSTNGDET